MLSKRPGTKADVDFSTVPPNSIGLEIVHKLGAKGFCVVAPGLEEDMLADLLKEVQKFDGLKKWGKVNGIIQDGLLGSEGSCLVSEMDSPDIDEEARTDGELLTKLDYTLTHVGFRMEPYLDHLGISISHRTMGLVHQSGEPDEDEEGAPLTEEIVTKWLGQFLRHKIMVITFLGPATGTLELLPYKTQDTDIHEIHTQAGMMVILRPDLLSHKFYSPGRSIAVSTFFLAGHLNRRSHAEGNDMIPPARELDEWTLQRLLELKNQGGGEMVYQSDIPRDWQQAMNHIFHQGQKVAVRGSAIKASRHDSVETLGAVSTAGVDYITEVPLKRWNHSEVYDPDMESWKYSMAYCRHGCFMEGTEYFDCKMFNMSAQEAKAIDPHQRLILDVGYSCLHSAGLRKNTLVNMPCGVYVGCGNLEWNYVPKDESGAFGATGAALSISSGRFSFTLGLKGPSMTLDTEASSGATAMFLAADAMQKKGRAAVNEMSLAIGAGMVLSPLPWATLCAQALMSFEGRCFSFNASAAGYVRADGVSAVVMKLLQEKVDDDLIVNDEGVLGTLAGSTMNNNGLCASLTAPNGAAEQEAVADAARNAGISVFDIEHVEPDGEGHFLHDAIEVGSHVRAHRTEEHKEPLALTGLKTSMGHQMESSAITCFLKTLHSAAWGRMTPIVHLRQSNPHIEVTDQPTTLLTECIEYKMFSSFSGNLSRGNGGSNIYLVSFGQVNQDKAAPQTAPEEREFLTFWPGGGGVLSDDRVPNREYTIAGSWGQWPEHSPMEPEGDGVFGFTVTLGLNRWEWFVIWLDGDPNKVLHPGWPKASKDFPVLGPVEDADTACWAIDARPEYAYVSLDRTSEMEGTYEIVEDEFGDKVAAYPVSTSDEGKPGDEYRVHLRVAGKWRTVTWERLTTSVPQDNPKVIGRYYLSADWNDWELEEMTADEKVAGLFVKEVRITHAKHEFTVIRNRDWHQILYPYSSDGAASSAMGPDELGLGYHWLIRETPGTTVRIELHRSAEETKVSWRRVDPK